MQRRLCKAARVNWQFLLVANLYYETLMLSTCMDEAWKVDANGLQVELPH
jgi:hypothetical protein